MIDGVNVRGRVVAWSSLASVSLVVATLMRIPYLFLPVSVDEGGYTTVIRSWIESGTMLEPVWVDRPQGLLFIYRAWDMVSWNPESIRVLAVVGGVIGALAIGDIARSLASERARHIAVILGAVVLASPLLEGYLANGEMLSLMLSLPGLALACRVLFRDASWSLMIPSGVLGGCAVMVKQSAFDGLLAVGLWLVIAWIVRWRTRPRAARELAACVLGATATIGMFFWHGITTLGWDDYWYAIYRYHGEQRSLFRNPRFGSLFGNFLPVAPALLVSLVVLAVFMRKQSVSRAWSTPRALFVALWSACAVGAFLSGGNYHRHYFLTLVAPLLVASAIVLDRNQHWWRPAMFSTGAVAVVSSVVLLMIPSLTLTHTPFKSERVAEWVRNESARQGRALSVYAFCTAASLYPMVDQVPQFRYLWRDGVELTEDADELLLEYLGGPQAPDVFARFQDCDVAPEVTALIDARYEPVTTINDVDLLMRK